jgi:hypothetical protein
MVSVELAGDGRTDLAIPLQVRLGDSEPISVELLVTLNVRVKS